MSDVVVTVPQDIWRDWIAEGGLPGQTLEHDVHYYYTVPTRPLIQPGERVYVVSCGKLRGYAPLVKVVIGRDPDLGEDRRPFIALVRQGGAVAVTLPRQTIRGFQGYRYRWWDRSIEVPFPNWRTP